VVPFLLGFQMIYFHSKNQNVGIIGLALEWSCWCILWTLECLRQIDKFYGHLVYFVVVWNIFTILACCKKINMAILDTYLVDSDFQRRMEATYVHMYKRCLHPRLHTYQYIMITIFYESWQIFAKNWRFSQKTMLWSFLPNLAVCSLRKKRQFFAIFWQNIKQS
jgi:hypothetical protein